ncbi:MAG: hypothetical protein NT003_03150 [Candidatus Magasanikbacteria bacterium]|nr:hypothetical protein [Candidatus Magasanikbacteria bacterium]
MKQWMYIWQPIVMNWWEGLSQDAKHDFIAAARREAEPKAPREVEEQMRASRIVGYRRLLGGMFERNPHRMYELYMAVKEGEKLSAPLGFGHEEAENWNKFIVDDWFESLSTEDRLRFDERADRLIRIPEQIKEKQTALSVLLDARKKHLRFFGNVKAFFAHEKDIAQKNFASEEQLNREIAALQQDLVALQTSAVIDELEDIDFARLYGWGERNGSGVAAIDATRNLFRWSRPNARSGMTQSPEGTVLSSLNGTRHNAPAAIEPWMLEAGSARATGMFDAGGAVAAGADATPQELMAHRRLIDKTQPTIDFPAYLLGIQQQIVKELERTIQKTIPLKSAIERDPLKGLLVAYHETIPYVAPELREQQGRVLVFIEEQLAQVEQDLSRRLGNGVQHLSLLPDNDLPWIAALLEERTIDERGTPPAPGTATTQGTETVEMGLRHSMDVDPGRSIKSHVYELIKTFDTTKTGPMLTRETAQFLHKGWVYEAGDKKQRTFMSHGIIQTPIYEGDRLTAIQDSRAPFGFRIEIARNTRRERPGYFEFDQSGKPQTYYQDAGDGVVNVWEADKHQSMKFRGQFEGKRFVDKPERVWMYKTLGERMHPIYEHMNDIYFEADGRVATKLRDLDGHGNRFRELGMLPEPFPAEVAVKKPDGTIVRVFLNDREHAYLVTPRNEVVEYHASVNDVRVLGTIES